MAGCTGPRAAICFTFGGPISKSDAVFILEQWPMGSADLLSGPRTGYARRRKLSLLESSTIGAKD